MIPSYLACIVSSYISLEVSGSRMLLFRAGLRVNRIISHRPASICFRNFPRPWIVFMGGQGRAPYLDVELKMHTRVCNRLSSMLWQVTAVWVVQNWRHRHYNQVLQQLFCACLLHYMYAQILILRLLIWSCHVILRRAYMMIKVSKIAAFIRDMVLNSRIVGMNSAVDFLRSFWLSLCVHLFAWLCVALDLVGRGEGAPKFAGLSLDSKSIVTEAGAFTLKVNWNPAINSPCCLAACSSVL